jgi:hypothetical protein
LSPRNCRGKTSSPPALVERCVRITIEKAKRDLRSWTPERNAEWASAFVVHVYRASGKVGLSEDVAAIDPWMALLPTPCPPCADGSGVGRCFAGEHRRRDDAARGVELGGKTGYYSDPFRVPAE